MAMLLELREALQQETGAPVRLDVLARRLGTDPAVLASLLDHPRTRSLVAGAAPVTRMLPERCQPTGCRPVSPACRHCPFAIAPEEAP